MVSSHISFSFVATRLSILHLRVDFMHFFSFFLIFPSPSLSPQVYTFYVCYFHRPSTHNAMASSPFSFSALSAQIYSFSVPTLFSSTFHPQCNSFLPLFCLSLCRHAFISYASLRDFLALSTHSATVPSHFSVSVFVTTCLFLLLLCIISTHFPPTVRRVPLTFPSASLSPRVYLSCVSA